MEFCDIFWRYCYVKIMASLTTWPLNILWQIILTLKYFALTVCFPIKNQRVNVQFLIWFLYKINVSEKIFKILKFMN